MPTRILVGTDGSATAARAVDRAVGVARSSGASLTIASAGEAGTAAEIVGREAERHSGSGVAIDTEVLAGDPVTALVERAAGGSFDLLVVGNKGMTGIARILRPGSVPSKVMHQIPCNILVVKTT